MLRASRRLGFGPWHVSEIRERNVSSPSHPAASPLSSRKSGALKGRVRPPGDKSISHRAFILGLLAGGVTDIAGLLEGDDVMRTGDACRALGAEIERVSEGAWRVRG